MNKKTEKETVVVESRQATRKINKKRNLMIKMTLVSVALVVFVGAFIGIAVSLAYSQRALAVQRNMYSGYGRGMESNYSRAYYDLQDGANDLDVKLKKLSVAGSSEKQQSLLYEVWGSACIAENNLAAFESSGEGVLKAQKFINQLSDYSHYLALRMSDGNPLNAEESATLDKLGGVMAVLKDSLRNVQKNLDDGRLFMDEKNGVIGDFSGAFKEFTNPALEYPEMIYDGPFSDALENRKPKGLKGAAITEQAGAAKIAEIFKTRGIKDIKYAGDTDNSISTHNYTFTIDGNTAFAEISKVGGMLVTFDTAVDFAETESAETESAASALSFAAGLGYSDMQNVWTSTANGMTYVNLAPVENGAVIYPDLIKVKLREGSGDVIGFDAMHYALNHTERTVAEPVLSEEEARAKVNLENVRPGRLALIPLQETKELLTYEFECEKNGTYYIYIDAATGKEANILYVIDTPQGIALQ